MTTPKEGSIPEARVTTTRLLLSWARELPASNRQDDACAWTRAYRAQALCDPGGCPGPPRKVRAVWTQVRHLMCDGISGRGPCMPMKVRIIPAQVGRLTRDPAPLASGCAPAPV